MSGRESFGALRPDGVHQARIGLLEDLARQAFGDVRPVGFALLDSLLVERVSGCSVGQEGSSAEHGREKLQLSGGVLRVFRAL